MIGQQFLTKVATTILNTQTQIRISIQIFNIVNEFDE